MRINIDDQIDFDEKTFVSDLENILTDRGRYQEKQADALVEIARSFTL